MSRSTRFGGRQLSGAFFNLGDAFPVIILTPLLERFIVPAAEKLLRREVTSNMKVLTGRIGPDEKACLAEFSDVCYDFDEFGF